MMVLFVFFSKVACIHGYLSKTHQDGTVPWDVYLSLSSLAEFVCESQLSCILV